MELGCARRLDNTARQQPSWQDGWDLDARRFIVRKMQDDDCDGGELWEVIDCARYAQSAMTRKRAQASIIADALEHLSLHALVDEFDDAMEEG